jgi:hypothetical protein
MRVLNLKFWSARQRGGWKLVIHIAVEGDTIKNSQYHKIMLYRAGTAVNLKVIQTAAEWLLYYASGDCTFLVS